MTAAVQPAVLHRASVDFRSVAFWAMIAVSAFGLWTLKKNFVPAMAAFPPSAALNTAVLCLSLAVGMWLARRILRPVQAPRWSGTWLALMWGGLAACGLAVVLNGRLGSVWSQALDLEAAGKWSAALTAPIDEELAKVAGVVLLAAVSTHLVRSAADGLVYGALVGLGFQVVENFTYGLNEIVTSGGVDPFAATFQTLWVRIVLTGIGSHWAMSAVAGAGIGYLVSASGRSAARRIWTALGCLLLAMAMHFVFDSPLLGGVAGTLAKPVLNFVIVMAVFIVVRRGFRARWAVVSAEEVAAGALTEDEAGSLSRRRSRRRYLRAFHGREREAQARLQRQQLALLEERVPERLPAAAAGPWRDAVAAARALN
ncbi:PrsW family intramembrane metalloprotease [Glycomyces dulcitolivorans]|uniref:PrsW family intramembrane metalloprotease n=1 Tax=Glycomyces dulcitolivorans TaxID=2200759 RepID=UPI000DD33641|nr:PrsW family intramembrane metalloprotease [Glycomyces dulcitolivorans]